MGLPGGVVALGGVTAALVLAVAASPFLPFVDLPQHVAAARLLWNLNRPELARLYEADLVPQVNTLALWIGAPLHAALPEAVAVRVLVGLGIVGLAGASLQLARSARVPAWAAVLAMPFALHFNWMYGFLSFGLGIPILLLLCARWASTLEDTPAGAAGSIDWAVWIADAVLWLLLVLAHALLAAFGALALGLYLGFPGDRRPRLRRATAAAPALLWGLAWLVHTRVVAERSDPGGGWGGIEAFWHGPGAKLAGFGRALVVASTGGRVEWLVLATVAAVAIVALVVATKAAAEPGAPGPRRFLRGVALVALLAYLLLPYSLYPRERVSYGLFILYPRFLVLAPLLFLPTLRWPSQRWLGRACAIMIVAANLSLAARDFTLYVQAGRDAEGLDQAIASIPPGRIVKSLVFTPFPHGFRYEGFLHVASYYQARALGETDQSFALLPTSPVHYRDPRRPYLSRQDEHLRPDRFDWRKGDLYDSVLIYDRNGRGAEAAARSGRPEVYARNGWIVLGPR